MQKISIRNCKNIESANISLVKGAVNIKYGHNGTGKTTISQAIRSATEESEADLDYLKPYGSEKLPEVSKIPFAKVMVFNDDYVKKYLFQEEGVFSDSYKVLLRSNECESLMNKLDEMLNKLQYSFGNNESVEALKKILDNYINTVNFDGDKIKKRGGVNDFIKGNGVGFDNHDELHVYRPFYQQKDYAKVSEWANWRTKGIKQMVDDDSCPFCATHVNHEMITIQNKSIETVFKASALKVASAVLKYLDDGAAKGYINVDAKKRLEALMGDPDKSDELSAELSSLAVETDYLIKKLKKILDFKPMNVTQEQLNDLKGNISSMAIDNKHLSCFYNAQSMADFISELNNNISDLIKDIGKLTGLFNTHENKINKLIDERKSDINHFFAVAGFPYKFEIEKTGEKQAKTYLTPIDNDKYHVNKPEDQLSWGEKNSFSLVMFMFEAVSENADLIVLDDPISSFDRTKKYAVIKRMLDSKETISFNGNTILMLTHDLQPIIDFVHGGFAKQYHLNVNANYIQNNKGKIIEASIDKDDLYNVVNQTDHLAKDKSLPLYVRIINCRKNIELTNARYEDNFGYQLLSNIIHGRDIPLLKISDIYKDMTEKQIEQGRDILTRYNIDASYEEMITELSVANLVKVINNKNNYYQTIAIRLLMEKCDGMLKKMRKEYPGACKFINETNHIENDYVFQLNPTKFFTIPEVYITDIYSFFKRHNPEIRVSCKMKLNS